MRVVVVTMLLAGSCFAVTPVLVHTVGSENSRGNGGTGGNTTFYIPNVDPVISGNCLGVAFEWSTAYSQPSGFTVTDDKSDTFYQVPENPNDTTNNYKMQVWIAPNVTSGAHYVEIPFGVQTTFIQAVTFEVANCGSTSGAITDGHSSNFGGGTAVTAGSLTPGNSGDLLLHSHSSTPIAAFQRRPAYRCSLSRISPGRCDTPSCSTAR
jgi:hypothetical protein